MHTLIMLKQTTNQKGQDMKYIISHRSHGVYSATDSIRQARKDLRAATMDIGSGWVIYDATGEAVR